MSYQTSVQFGVGLSTTSVFMLYLTQKIKLNKERLIIIRARARRYEHGERSSKYFLNLEKRNHVKKHIRKLTVNNSLTTDLCTILSQQKRFHKDL